MTDFHKQRIERMEKAFCRSLCQCLYLRDENSIDTVRMILRDFSYGIVEAINSRPNKELKGNFFAPLPDYGDLMTLTDFQEYCKSGMFIDYDGTGHPVGHESAACEQLWMDPNVTIRPSEYDDVPEGTTHVMWFNR